MSGPLVLALDVGGTNMRGEVLDARLGAPVASLALPTPERDGEATLSAIEILCRRLLDQLAPAQRERVEVVGLGVPGIVDPVKGVVRLAGNLGWVNMPVAARLSERIRLPVLLHHDVTAAGLAEQVLGAGSGVEDLLAVFIGTGIAATIVVGGKPVRGGLHQAGEIGHVPISPDGRLCPCGQRGCLEMYSSARAIGRAYGEATGNPDATSLDVVNALGTDPRADAVWAEALDALAHGLLGAITLLSPSRVVIGGGLSGAGSVLVEPLRARLVARARVAAIPPIVTARLGQRAGVLGAALATFRTLAKQFTIFGQHVHIGCPGPDEALHLMHMLSRYVPHFIALSASSPFVQGHDTGFASARLNSVFSFPLSGRAPFVLRWNEFEQFFDKMTTTGVVESMKDFYWDIRPKPEFGTIEVRVCDTPLTVEIAAAIACYIQAMSRYIMVEQRVAPEEDDYLVYTFNRFQACRFGLEGVFIDPRTHEQRSVREDIADMLTRIADHATELRATEAMERLREILAVGNGTSWLRQTYAREHNLGNVMQLQAELWMGGN